MKTPIRPYWDLLAQYIRPQAKRFILLSVLLLGNIGLQIINPQVMRAFIDSALGQGAVQDLLRGALIFILIAFVQQGVSVAVTYLGENVAWTATNALRANLAAHLLRLDMSFHNKHTPGELIERIDGDITELATFFSQLVVLVVGNLLLMVGILAALFREDWRAGIAFTIFSVITMTVLTLLRDYVVPEENARRQAEADLFAYIEEQLHATEDVRSSGATEFVLHEMTRLQAGILRTNRKSNFKNWVISDIITAALLTVGNLMAIGTGYWLFTGGAITVGTVYLFIHYINLLEQPIWMLTREVKSLQTIGACVQRLNALQGERPQVMDGTVVSLPPGAPGVTFEGVSFTYHDNESNEPVLRDLNFKITPGSVLGLLGRTGSGKTTLTRLVFRFYDPSVGCVSYSGTNLRDCRIDTIRKQIAVVTQEVQLFRASLRDNLTFFNRTILDAEIISALDDLGLGEWFRALPQGLDTQLESGVHSLSAGEAQLLTLTRVFLRNPSLVILDEASSRLDPATEQRIERAVDKLLRDRTAIIIAHRLNTVHRADDILILEKGQMSEFGPRAELAADPTSKFFSLLQTGMEEVLV